MSTQAILRNLRIMYALYLITIPLFLCALVLMRPQERHVPLAITVSLVALSGWLIFIALSFRSRKILPALEMLRRNPEDAAALSNWYVGNVTSFAFAETIVLFGVVLKLFGAGWKVAGVFFALGVFLFLVWTPRLDLPTAS